MSLSGIAISIGILVDAVDRDGRERHPRAHRGTSAHERVTGDTASPSCSAPAALVGRPIFFSVVIMLISFLPVFALGGMEGKMFHPLAFTKTFAMIGVAMLSITLVPALMPTFLRGRMRAENENPIVRSFIDIYKPVLQFLLRHPKPFIWSFVVLLGIGFNLARHVGREFMPPLDEGSIMEMPVTIPSVSISRAGEDLKVRDAVLRSFPEVESVVGKAGRADTPTDPAPPDMIETMVNLRPKPLWPRRHINFEDIVKEGGTLLELLGERGVVKRDLTRDEREAVVNAAAMGTAEEMDALFRARVGEAVAGIPETANEKTWKRSMKALDLELARRAPGDMVPALAAHLATAAESQKLSLRALTDQDRAALLARREKPLLRNLFLWRATRSRAGAGDGQCAPDARLGQHLDAADHQPGGHAGHRRPHHGRGQGLRGRSLQDPGGVRPDRRRAARHPRRGGCVPRPDRGRKLPGDRSRSPQGGPLRGERGGCAGDHRDRAWRKDHHHHRRGAAALRGAGALRPRLPRG